MHLQLPSVLWNHIADFGSLQDNHQLTLVSKDMRQSARNSEAFSFVKVPITTFIPRNGVTFASFFYDVKTRMVVTGERSKPGHARVRLWTNGGQEIGDFQHNGLFLLITRLSIDHSRNELTVTAALSPFKIFDLDTRREKKVLKKHSRFVNLSFSKNPQNLYDIDVRELTNFFPGSQSEGVRWAIKDRRIHRIFTSPYDNNECGNVNWKGDIKFWDSQSNKRITKITQVFLRDATIYDHSRSEMICARKEKELHILDGKDGRVKAKFKVNDRDTKILAFTYCSKTRKLVAAYEQTQQLSSRVKVAVWDIKTVQIVASFSPKDPISSINSLFYNEKSHTLLIGGHGTQLWDMDSGQIIRKLTERSDNPIIHWDQDQNTVIIMNRNLYQGDPEDAKLRILNYGNLRQRR
ncbi:MAG TPA: hypothetical protein VLG76_01395 [Rhabdochlamydiaceae bacterium]|nr:hypothetical protein [Rhabdochlamydiaceae bacterium]